MVGESVPAKSAVFLEEMMNKEGSRECQVADLVNEGREMVRENEFYVGKLMRDARINFKVGGNKGAIVKVCRYLLGCVVWREIVDKEGYLEGSLNLRSVKRISSLRNLRATWIIETIARKEMMNKEGSRECQVANLVNEGREMVRENEFYVGKLMRDARS
nr:hypothetical protein [Tanacetum cinerariifolium]